MLIRHRAGLCCVVIAGLFSPRLLAAEAKTGTKPDQTASEFVEQALVAEMKGDSEGRAKLLAEAIKYDPNHAVARWHLGQIRVGEEWLSLQEAEAKATQGGTITEYRQLRASTPATEAGHVAAARWCRKNNLLEQEKLHWMMVLQLNSKNQEARGRLGLKEFAGRLLTSEGIEQEKAWRKEMEQATTHWQEWVKERRTTLQKGDSSAKEDALAEIKQVKDPIAIFALEAGFSTMNESAALAVVEALTRMKEQVATDSLVRHAVLSDSAKVREAALKELKARPLHSYVPILLSNLKAPLEFAQTSSVFGEGMSRSFVFEREGQTGVFCDVKSLNKMIYLSGPQSSNMSLAQDLVRQRMWLDARAEWERGTRIKLVVDQLNKANEPLNERVYAALEYCTGEDCEKVPRQWWRWWEEYNEVASDNEKPVDYRVDAQYESKSYYIPGPGAYQPSSPATSGSPRMPRIGMTLSADYAPRSHNYCFLRGTLVTTETGTMPIEQVQPGDRVLSQSTETGELGYRVVTSTSIRPPRATRQIVLPDERIVSTLGHPFWVDGQGWRMAKELKAGDVLHGVGGGVKVQAVEDGAEAEVYNMVVADFGSYFVGKNRVLVHDNSPRKTSHAIVPGLVANDEE